MIDGLAGIRGGAGPATLSGDIDSGSAPVERPEENSSFAGACVFVVYDIAGAGAAEAKVLVV
jgi:hypothetical protein